jgi:hypothetical protein
VLVLDYFKTNGKKILLKMIFLVYRQDLAYHNRFGITFTDMLSVPLGAGEFTFFLQKPFL